MVVLPNDAVAALLSLAELSELQSAICRMLAFLSSETVDLPCAVPELLFVSPNDATVTLFSLTAVSELLSTMRRMFIMKKVYHRAAAYSCSSFALPRSDAVEVRVLII